MNEQATRYPLAWPVGWRRTPKHQRRRGAFKAYKGQMTVAAAIGRLSRELRLLGARGELLSSNVILRLDGMPRSDQREPDDPGAAVYFRLKDKPTVLACDKWDRIADNIAALASHIDALRRIDRYGVGSMEQAFAGYAALTTGKRSWWEVLGFDGPSVKRPDIEERYIMLAKQRHPDVGGTTADFQELVNARDDALREVQA